MICYSMHCVETIMSLVFDSTKVKWFALYHTNLSHEVPLSFVWLKFSSFGWDVDMRRIKSDKTLSLGMPKAPQGNIQGRSKQLSLGMPRKASPLSSPTLSENRHIKGMKKTQELKLGDAPVGIPPFFFKNYRLVLVDPKFLLLHMICAILGMSFYFVCLLF